MTEQRPSWLAAPNISWVWMGMASLLWSIVLLAAVRSEVGHYLEARLSRPLDFRMREALGQSPAVSSQLKIYSLDDSTFSKLGTASLSFDQWQSVLETLQKSEPRAIFIDQMFSMSGSARDPKNAGAIQALKNLKVPVIVGSFITPTEVKYRHKLTLGKPDYSLTRMVGAGPMDPIAEANLPPMADRTLWFAYGPAAELEPVFAHVGHFSYLGSGVVEPLVRLDNDVVLSHMALFLANERRIANGQLLLDGARVPLDQEGKIIVNFPSPEAMRTANKSLRAVVAKAEAGKPLELLNKGDVVLILPAMFTGNTDFAHSPFGYVPGGLVIASLLNSVLTENWLRPLADGGALVCLMVVLGALLGFKCAALSFWTAVLGTVLVLLGASQYLFAYQGVVVPWLFPLTGFVGAAVTVFAEKTRVSERKVQALRNALEGSVAEADLKTILSHPERITLEARERVVTLMFIDVVGFSLLAENMLPRIAFDNLKKMLATFGDTIHEFGGIIDKTLGDGLLCYFGYRFDQDTSSPDHAEKALRCAIKIQRDNVMRNIEAAENGEPVYPLRIGINTSSCYLGDLGTSNRIDFTVVGNGVNFAKRLEGASEMHSVLMGGTTYDLVKGIGLPSKAISKRFIRIKHHSELVEAYEYDPVHDEPHLRLVALDGFRKSANIERLDQRWPVHDPSKIKLRSDFGEGQLVNFSHTGLSVKLPQLLAKGTRLNITLDGAGGALRDLLVKEGIEILHGEVRWGYGEGSEYVHGVLLTNVTEKQSDYLVQYLCEFAFSKDADGKAASPKAS